MSRPSILYCYQYFGTPKGGWSTRVYEMARRWVAEGYEVTVLTTPYDKSDIKPSRGLTTNYEVDGIKVKVLNFNQSNRFSKIRRMWQFMKFVVFAVYYVMRLQYDVVVTSSGPITVGLLGIVAKKIRGKKFVFEVRDLWPEGAVALGIINNNLVKRMSYKLEAACYAYADLIVCCSTGMEQNIRKRFSYKKTLVVPNAADTDLFVPASQSEIWEQPLLRVIYTGSLGVMDDCMQIMRAAALLDEPYRQETEWLIVGDGIDRKRMEEFAISHRLDFVKFTGLVPKTTVADWLRTACCAIICFRNIPVLNTVSPNKLFDAFAAGVPVVQTTNGWIAELVSENACGTNVAADDPKAMITAVQQYLSNQKIRAIHSKNAHALALQVFNRDICARQMLEAIEGVHQNKNVEEVLSTIAGHATEAIA